MSDFDTPPPNTIPNQKLVELLEHHRSETLEFAKDNARLKRYITHLQLRIELLEQELQKVRNGIT